MKCTAIILAILLCFTGCSAKGLTPIEVRYEVQSLAEYNKQVEISTLTRNLSDFRMMEFDIKEVPYCNMYDYVILQGAGSIDYDKTINAVTTDFIELEETDTLKIYDAILSSKSIKLKTSGLYIPSLDELTAQAKSSPIPDIFIKSILKEIGA